MVKCWLPYNKFNFPMYIFQSSSLFYIKTMEKNVSILKDDYHHSSVGFPQIKISKQVSECII